MTRPQRFDAFVEDAAQFGGVNYLDVQLERKLGLWSPRSVHRAGNFVIIYALDPVEPLVRNGVWLVLRGQLWRQTRRTP